MPTISCFYGIIIVMYLRNKEHNPPHVHVLYGEYMGTIEIESLQMAEGDLPPKALSMAQEWVKLHQAELLTIWNTQNFIKLPPLE